MVKLFVSREDEEIQFQNTMDINRNNLPFAIFVLLQSIKCESIILIEHNIFFKSFFNMKLRIV